MIPEQTLESFRLDEPLRKRVPICIYSGNRSTIVLKGRLNIDRGTLSSVQSTIVEFCRVFCPNSQFAIEILKANGDCKTWNDLLVHDLEDMEQVQVDAQ